MSITTQVSQAVNGQRNNVGIYPSEKSIGAQFPQPTEWWRFPNLEGQFGNLDFQFMGNYKTGADFIEYETLSSNYLVAESNKYWDSFSSDQDFTIMVDFEIPEYPQRIFVPGVGGTPRVTVPLLSMSPPGTNINQPQKFSMILYLVFRSDESGLFLPTAYIGGVGRGELVAFPAIETPTVQEDYISQAGRYICFVCFNKDWNQGSTPSSPEPFIRLVLYKFGSTTVLDYAFAAIAQD